jgi:hypothetical protein
MKKKTSKKTKTKETKPEQKQAPEQENQSGFDFGGIPDRDLKKNLGGCG